MYLLEKYRTQIGIVLILIMVGSGIFLFTSNKKSSKLEVKEPEKQEVLDKIQVDIEGAVVNPGADPIELQLLKMKKKIDCGAKYFQTQAVFDIDKFSEFMNQARKFEIPIIGGIIILKSAGMARFMNDNIAGVQVPEKYIKKIANTDKSDRPKVAIEISTELIEGMKNLCQGVHIMALGWERYVPDLLRATSLI